MVFRLLTILLFENSKKSSNSIEQIIASSFYERVDFITPTGDLKKTFVFIRNIIKVILKQKSINSNFVSGNIDNLHIHNASKGIDVWRSVIQEQQPGNNFVSLSYTDLNLKLPLSYTFKMYGCLLYSFLIYFRHFVFSKQKSTTILRIPEIIYILFELELIIKKNALKQLFFTGAYQQEANLISYLFTENKVPVDIYVSGTPLKKYLSKIVANNLYLSNPYQLEEATKIFQKTIMVQKNIIVLPPHTHKQLKLNRSIDTQLNKNIGIYTTGAWKRKKLGIYFDEEVLEKEKNMFEFIDKYVSEYRTQKVIIFLHPIEKKNQEEYQHSVEYFLSLITNKNNFSFSDINMQTTRNFNMVDIAITVLSNTLFERLYCGYKTIIINSTNDWFPFHNSSLTKIAASDYKSFCLLTNKSLSISPYDFFHTFNIKGYLAPLLNKSVD